MREGNGESAESILIHNTSQLARFHDSYLGVLLQTHANPANNMRPYCCNELLWVREKIPIFKE